MIDRRRLTVLVGVGMALAAGGIVFAALVLTTSGPFASNDDDASTTPLAVTVTPTPTEAPGPEVTPTPEPPVLELDADGWPIVNCPDGWEHRKSDLLRATFCIPPGWDMVHTPATVGDPPHYDTVEFIWTREDSSPPAVVQVSLVSRAVTPSKEGLELPCARPVQRPLAGSAGSFCLALAEDHNGVGVFYPLYGWQAHGFAETETEWVVVNAGGPQEAEDRDEILATVTAILDHLLWDGGPASTSLSP